jgi:IclR family transcriptional regulator, KDG regulon repressor
MNIQIIDRVGLILTSFSVEKFEMGVSELSKETGLSKTTTHRLANAMVNANLLSYNPNMQKYRLGISLMHMGNLVKNNLSLAKIAEPHMTNLKNQVDEPVMLKVVDKDYAVTIEYIETNKYYRPKSGVGRRDLLYAGASAKVLLAFFKDDEIERVLNKGMDRLTENTLDHDSLLEQLSEIRKNGYATSFGERVEDGVGVSVPVYDFRQKVVASLTVVGASGRMTMEKINEILPLIKETANVISKELGFSPSQKINRGINAAELI